MRLRVVLPLLCLPLCLWAKEDNMVQKADPLLENTANADGSAEMNYNEFVHDAAVRCAAITRYMIAH